MLNDYDCFYFFSEKILMTDDSPCADTGAWQGMKLKEQESSVLISGKKG